MLGPILVIVALLIAIPVAVLVSSAIVPIVMGTVLVMGADADHAGSELIDTNI